METITFYSYKGGVGRTLALANIAMYLSRFGLNVCIMDFDLEAPGLHYKFPHLVNTTDIKKGLVDYIYEFVNKAVVPPLDGFTLELSLPSESRGSIRLIPAGDALSSEYWRKLASIDWHDLFYEKESEGIPFFLELKEIIKEKYNPDFLLIDSRTGITEMSGLCTSLLPDKVVFLIINNRENLEGARQILWSIQRVERLPGQEPTKVVFALTRIPSPKNEKDEEKEERVTKNIQNFLNEPVRDLESQLDIQNICILHSDRELEFSESLRLSHKSIAEETPLSMDYLRLFSIVISQEDISPGLDRVLEEVTATERLFEDPDGVQKELEGLVASYPHPKSFEKLINLYIVRNAGREKLLGAFHRWWEKFGIADPKILSKYVSLFIEYQLGGWKKQVFKLGIVEKYLDSNPGDRLEVERKLADVYNEYGNPEMALKNYKKVLNEIEDKGSILTKILDILIESKHYDEAMEFIEKYSDIIDSSIDLKARKIRVFSGMGRIEEAQKLLDESTENTLFGKDPPMCVTLMKEIGESERANKKLDEMLSSALGEGSLNELIKIGGLYYRMDRAEEFKQKIKKNPLAGIILGNLDCEY
ncbi:MAG: AAA family ATPase [Theionarchaea archaeon]|nr:AAA family ATPase [Theionarchaea archaeon]